MMCVSRRCNRSSDGVYSLCLERMESRLLLNATPSALNLASLASDNSQGNDASWYPDISADGNYISFYSTATNLVAADTNDVGDIFVHNQATGLTQRVSLSVTGAQALPGVWADVDTPEHGLSADGRHVAFYSYADNLFPGDLNGTADVFVRDLDPRLTECISVALDGTPGNGLSRAPAISRAGAFVAFESTAMNLVTGGTNGLNNIFLRLRILERTERVTVGWDGSEPNGDSSEAAITPDANFIVFTSAASNLVPGDTNGASDVFLYDRMAGTIERVSLISGGGEANGASWSPSISDDGRYVAFVSSATDFVAGDTNGRDDIFVHDRVTGATVRVNLSEGGAEANGTSRDPAISPDGSYVAYTSAATNLVPFDTNGRDDVFVVDGLTGLVEQPSRAPDRREAVKHSGHPALSDNGRYVVFDSFANNLATGDRNNRRDVLVLDREAGLGIEPLREWWSPSGEVTVSVYDVIGIVDVNPNDVDVRFGAHDAVARIRFDGEQPMEGLGIIISGARTVGSIKDMRDGPLGDVAFVASDAPVGSLTIESPMVGFELDGLLMGGIQFPDDIDGQLGLDATAIFMDAWLSKAVIAGDVTGDVSVGSNHTNNGLALRSFTTDEAEFHADMIVNGNARKIVFEGHFGSSVYVAGTLGALTVLGGDLNGLIQVDGLAGKIETRSVRDRDTDTYVGGNVGVGGQLVLNGLAPNTGISLKSFATRGGDFLGALTSAGAVVKFDVRGGDLSGILNVGDYLKKVSVKADKRTGGGDVLDAAIAVGRRLTNLRADGDFVNSDIAARSIGKVQVRGVIGCDDDLAHEIRATRSTFAISDETWRGVLDPFSNHLFDGVLAWVGTP